MANSYSGFFQTLHASFKEISKSTGKHNALLSYVYTDVAPSPTSALFSTINVNVFANDATVTDLAVGSRLTPSDVNVAPTPVTLDKHPSVAFPMPLVDRTKGFSDDYVEGVRDAGIKAIANELDKYIAALVVDGNFTTTPIVSGVAGDIPDAALASALSALGTNNVPILDQGEMFLVTGMPVYSKLLQNPSWSQQAYVGPISSGIRQSARLGSQWNAWVDYDTAMPANRALYFHRNAIAFVSRPLALSIDNVKQTIVYYQDIPIKVTIANDLLGAQDLIMFEALVGVKVVRPDHAVIIKTVTA